MPIRSRSWNENQRRGYIIAREFVILQFYVWAAVFVTLFVLLIVQDRWGKDPQQAILIGLITFLITYFPVQYIRLVHSAWQIWKERVPPPEVTPEAERESIQSAQDALSKLLSGS